MGRKSKLGGKIKCRYGCGATFGSMTGRRSHEIKIHGGLFSKKPLVSSPIQENNPHVPPIEENNNFIEVKDVKFEMAKTTKEPKKSTEYENECGKCGYEFNGDAKFCPGCGVPFAD